MSDKKKKRRKLARNIFIAGVVVGAGAAYYYSQRPIRDYEEKEVEIPSRRSAIIKATTIVPQTTRKMPLVIFAHGFGAERTEGSRFTLIAKNIARNGIASIMLDFSGCGKSEEEYTEYCLSNNLTDMECCLAYMKENYRIDEKKIGVVGYSMGGRAAVQFASVHPEIQAMALFAPAVTQGFKGFESLFGNENHMKELEKQAQREGYILYDDPFGTQKKISSRFFADLKHDAVDDLSRYKKHLLYVQGAADTMVKPEISGIALQSMNPECRLNYVYIDNADHGFGLWDNQPDQSERLVDVTSKFLGKNL